MRTVTFRPSEESQFQGFQMQAMFQCGHRKQTPVSNVSSTALLCYPGVGRKFKLFYTSTFIVSNCYIFLITSLIFFSLVFSHKSCIHLLHLFQWFLHLSTICSPKLFLLTICFRLSCHLEPETFFSSLNPLQIPWYMTWPECVNLQMRKHENQARICSNTVFLQSNVTQHF